MDHPIYLIDDPAHLDLTAAAYRLGRWTVATPIPTATARWVTAILIQADTDHHDARGYWALHPYFAVAQQALESNYWQFTGKVPAGFHNPLGLKVPDPDPEDADAARVFEQYADPAHACHAQRIHWDAYTDRPLTPNERRVDPRADVVIRWAPKITDKPATTAHIGGGVWATDPNYGAKIAGIIDAIRNA